MFAATPHLHLDRLPFRAAQCESSARALPRLRPRQFSPPSPVHLPLRLLRRLAHPQSQHANRPVRVIPAKLLLPVLAELPVRVTPVEPCVLVTGPELESAVHHSAVHDPFAELGYSLCRAIVEVPSIPVRRLCVVINELRVWRPGCGDDVGAKRKVEPVLWRRSRCG